MPIFSPFIGDIPMGLPFTINGIFNYSIYFCLSWEGGVLIVMAVLAATSAASFPGIPICDGTHSIFTSSC